MPQTPTQRAIIEWLANGDTGLSSQTMAFWLGFGVRSNANRYPHDATDFGRCLALLDAAPALRDRLIEMAVLSPQWESLMMYWSEIEQRYRKDQPRKQFIHTNSLINEALAIGRQQAWP